MSETLSERMAQDPGLALRVAQEMAVDMIGEAIRRRMAEVSISGTVLSHRLGRNPQYIRQYLRGRDCNNGTRQLAAIALELGCVPHFELRALEGKPND